MYSSALTYAISVGCVLDTSVVTVSQYLLSYSKVGSDAGVQYCDCVSFLHFVFCVALQIFFGIKLK